MKAICKCGKEATVNYTSLSKLKKISLCQDCSKKRGGNLIKGHNYVIEQNHSIDDLIDHWCAYNGVHSDNKEELINLINQKNETL